MHGLDCAVRRRGSEICRVADEDEFGICPGPDWEGVVQDVGLASCDKHYVGDGPISCEEGRARAGEERSCCGGSREHGEG